MIMTNLNLTFDNRNRYVCVGPKWLYLYCIQAHRLTRYQITIRSD